MGASYVNIPIIGLRDVDSPLKYIDVVIPCNNKGKDSVGLMWWFLARETLRLKGELSRAEEWEIMPDLFFYRNAGDIKKQEQEDLAKIAAEKQDDEAENFDNAGFEQNANQDWADEAGNDQQDWAAEGTAAQQ